MIARVRLTVDIPFDHDADTAADTPPKVDKQRRAAAKDSQKVADELAKRLSGSMNIVDVLVEEVRDS